MPDQRRCDALIKQHRIGPRRRLNSARPQQGAFGRALAHAFGAGHIGGKGAPFGGPIAFHLRARPCEGHRRNRVGRAFIAARKPVAGRQMHPPPRPRGRGFNLRDPARRKRCSLGPAGIGFQHLGAGFAGRIAQFQPCHIPALRQLISARQAHRFIGRRFTRHRHGTFGQPRQSGGRYVRRRHTGLPLAHHHAQAHLDPLGAFGLFQLALTDVD